MTYFGSRVDESSESMLSSAEGVIAVLTEAAEKWPKEELKVNDLLLLLKYASYLLLKIITNLFHRPH